MENGARECAIFVVMEPMDVSPIFIAASVSEAEFVEKLLEREGIEYQVTPEAFLGGALSGRVCYQGLLFEVSGGQAQYCRDLLTRAGLERGVVSPPDV